MKTYKITFIIEDEIEALDKEHAEATFWYYLSCDVYDGFLKVEEKGEEKCPTK